MQKLVIAIDGPSGAGKSTVGKALARRLGLLYIDSGAVYRAVACRALDSGVSLNDPEALARAAKESRIELEGDPEHLRIILDDQDVTERIRRPDATHAASIVATVPAVRKAVIEKLRSMSQSQGVVMDGRDIGTKVFPDAPVKLFLDASHRQRAHRRWLEEGERGRSVTLETIETEMEQRDRRDRERTATPLIKAEDAFLIETSDRPLESVIQCALEIVAAHREK